MTIGDIENRIIQTLEGSGLFRKVISAGRKAIPPVLSYPAALVWFLDASNAGIGSRLVMVERYQVIIVSKNLASEMDAARSSYDLLVAVRDAIHGRDFGSDDLAQMALEHIALASYEDGEIAYALTFAVTHTYGAVTRDE